jgi:hypothetical protein
VARVRELIKSIKHAAVISSPILRLGWAHARARHPAAMKRGLDMERGGSVSGDHEADQNSF